MYSDQWIWVSSDTCPDGVLEPDAKQKRLKYKCEWIKYESRNQSATSENIEGVLDSGTVFELASVSIENRTRKLTLSPM
jgi:hypothetical protein